MRIRLTTVTVLFLAATLVLAKPPNEDHHKTADQPCKLTPANPRNFHPFQFVPKQMDFQRLNRFPKVAYVVNEDGSVGDVKIVKGTGSPVVDAGLIKSIQAWKYKPQPGCTVETSMSVIIDIGRK